MTDMKMKDGERTVTLPLDMLEMKGFDLLRIDNREGVICRLGRGHCVFLYCSSLLESGQ